MNDKDFWLCRRRRTVDGTVGPEGDAKPKEQQAMNPMEEESTDGCDIDYDMLGVGLSRPGVAEEGDAKGQKPTAIGRGRRRNTKTTDSEEESGGTEGIVASHLDFEFESSQEQMSSSKTTPSTKPPRRRVIKQPEDKKVTNSKPSGASRQQLREAESMAKAADEFSEEPLGFGVQGKSMPRTTATTARKTGNHHRNSLPSQRLETNEEKVLLSQTLNVRYVTLIFPERCTHGMCRWCEVELMLRKRIACDADIDATLAAAEEGLEFMKQMNALSKSLGILRGTLSRWILPYDSSTSITEQCSTPQSVLQNMPEGVRGQVSERLVRTLVLGANNVRQLVRVKIADDNDLEQAKKALETTVEFFHRIKELAAIQELSPYALLNFHG